MASNILSRSFSPSFDGPCCRLSFLLYRLGNSKEHSLSIDPARHKCDFDRAEEKEKKEDYQLGQLGRCCHQF